MALYTQKGSTIPTDAVRISEDDAVKFMRTIVESWKERSEVRYLAWSPGVLGGLTALTSVYANNYYRTRLRLQSFGRMSTYLPIVALPAFASLFTHYAKIQSSVLIDRYQCPVCLELKAVIYQGITGVVYPLMMAPLLGFMTAARYYTYNVPPAQKDPWGVWRLYLKLSKPLKTTFVAMGSLHILTAAFLTYKEMGDVARLKQKLMQMEEEAENSV